MRESPEAAAAAAKAAPPLAVTGMTVAGYPLADWVLVATLLYTLLQIVVVVRRMLWQRRAGDPEMVCAENCPALRKHKEGGHIRQRVAAGLLALSAGSLVLLAQDEGYTGSAVVPVPGDVPTIGFGSTEGVKLGDRTDPVRALVRLSADADRKARAVAACLADVPLYQHEFDAYVQLAYNVGARAVCESSIRPKLQRGDYAAACKTILDFDGFRDRSQPKVRNPNTGRLEYPLIRIKGLTIRRQRDYALCMGDPAK